jgi:hypothetical protein
MAAAAPCTNKAKDGVVFRERRNIACKLRTSGLPDHRQAHKTASAALDAGKAPAPEPAPKRRTRDSQSPDGLADRQQILRHHLDRITEVSLFHLSHFNMS